jgi:hypothetical protein
VSGARIVNNNGLQWAAVAELWVRFYKIDSFARTGMKNPARQPGAGRN